MSSLFAIFGVPKRRAVTLPGEQSAREAIATALSDPAYLDPKQAPCIQSLLIYGDNRDYVGGSDVLLRDHSKNGNHALLSTAVRAPTGTEKFGTISTNYAYAMTGTAVRTVIGSTISTTFVHSFTSTGLVNSPGPPAEHFAVVNSNFGTLNATGTGDTVFVHPEYSPTWDVLLSDYGYLVNEAGDWTPALTQAYADAGVKAADLGNPNGFSHLWLTEQYDLHFPGTQPFASAPQCVKPSVTRNCYIYLQPQHNNVRLRGADTARTFGLDLRAIAGFDPSDYSVDYANGVILDYDGIMISVVDKGGFDCAEFNVTAVDLTGVTYGVTEVTGSVSGATGVVQSSSSTKLWLKDVKWGTGGTANGKPTNVEVWHITGNPGQVVASMNGSSYGPEFFRGHGIANEQVSGSCDGLQFLDFYVDSHTTRTNNGTNWYVPYQRLGAWDITQKCFFFHHINNLYSDNVETRNARGEHWHVTDFKRPWTCSNPVMHGSNSLMLSANAVRVSGGQFYDAYGGIELQSSVSPTASQNAGNHWEVDGATFTDLDAHGMAVSQGDGADEWCTITNCNFVRTAGWTQNMTGILLGAPANLIRIGSSGNGNTFDNVRPTNRSFVLDVTMGSERYFITNVEFKYNTIIASVRNIVPTYIHPTQSTVSNPGGIPIGASGPSIDYSYNIATHANGYAVDPFYSQGYAGALYPTNDTLTFDGNQIPDLLNANNIDQLYYINGESYTSGKRQTMGVNNTIGGVPIGANPDNVGQYNLLSWDTHRDIYAYGYHQKCYCSIAGFTITMRGADLYPDGTHIKLSNISSSTQSYTLQDDGTYCNFVTPGDIVMAPDSFIFLYKNGSVWQEVDPVGGEVTGTISSNWGAMVNTAAGGPTIFATASDTWTLDSTLLGSVPAAGLNEWWDRTEASGNIVGEIITKSMTSMGTPVYQQTAPTNLTYSIEYPSDCLHYLTSAEQNGVWSGVSTSGEFTWLLWFAYNSAHHDSTGSYQFRNLQQANFYVNRINGSNIQVNLQAAVFGNWPNTLKSDLGTTWHLLGLSGKVILDTEHRWRFWLDGQLVNEVTNDPDAGGPAVENMNRFSRYAANWYSDYFASEELCYNRELSAHEHAYIWNGGNGVSAASF